MCRKSTDSPEHHLEIGHLWSARRHADKVLAIFSPTVSLSPLLWGQFPELWQLRSWWQFGPRVNFFHLVGVAVSVIPVGGCGSILPVDLVLCGCSVTYLGCVQFFATPWNVAHQAPLSMGFPRQEILEWVAISSSRGFSWPWDQTHIFCIAGRFFFLTPKPSREDCGPSEGTKAPWPHLMTKLLLFGLLWLFCFCIFYFSNKIYSLAKFFFTGKRQAEALGSRTIASCSISVNSKCLWRNSVSSVVLTILCAWFHLILTTTLSGRYFYCPIIRT